MDDKEINKRLDQLIKLHVQSVKLSALTLTKDLTLTDSIYRLYKAGFGPTDIADILGTTPNMVNVRLSEMRKRGRL